MNNTNTELSLINTEDIRAIVTAAPEALTNNQRSVDKALSVGQSILDAAESGMSDELDIECNKYLVRVRETLEACNGRRAPLTKIFDQIRTTFTSLEGAIDTKKKDSIPSKIQALRDGWATKKAHEEKARQAELQRKADFEKEKINKAAEYERALIEKFLALLSYTKQALQTIFDGITLEKIRQGVELVSQFPVKYSDEIHEGLRVSLTSLLLAREDLIQITAPIRSRTREEFAQKFESDLIGLRTKLTQELPGKRKVLEEIAEQERTNKAEAQRLRDMEEQRKKDAQAAIEKKSQDDAKAASANIEATAQAQTANTLFDIQAEAIKEVGQAAGTIKEGLELVVSSAPGYLQVVAFYFQKEGAKEPVEKLAKKTLGSMVTFAQKWANDTGETIDSPFLKYEAKIKTISRK